MIDLAKGHPAPRYGKLLTENEHRKLMETIYIPELDKTLSKDCWEEVILPALRIVNALHEESLAGKGIEHHEPQEKPIKVVS